MTPKFLTVSEKGTDVLPISTDSGMILEINGRLEIGRKFFSSLGSRLGFFEKRKDDSTFENLGK